MISKKWLCLAVAGIAGMAAFAGVAQHTLTYKPFEFDASSERPRRLVEPATVQPPSTQGPFIPSVVDLSTLSPSANNTAVLPRAPVKKEQRPEAPGLTEEQADQLRAAAALQPIQSQHVQTLRDNGHRQAPLAIAGPILNLISEFEGPDMSECCGAGGAVPPDPDLAVGTNHVVAVVNSAIAVYSKNGALLSGPIEADSFFQGVTGCTGSFDPVALYDEQADRFIIGFDANDGKNFCMAATQTGNPAGAWNRYSFGTVFVNGEFFDYPHAGVGQNAIFLGSNIFGPGNAFTGRVFSINKAQLYAGQPLSTPVRKDIADGTPWPMQLHGTAPADGAHYFVTDNDFDGNVYSVWKWTEPNNAATAMFKVGTIDLAAFTGVTANFPIDQTQLGVSVAIQGNDWRTLDAEWRNGNLWFTHQMSCNIGAGPTGCIRWAQLNPVTPSVTQAGVISIFGKSLSFPNLAVDANNNMAIGFTTMGPTKRPSVYVAGRMSTDTPNILRDPVEVKKGETIYSAFDGSPGRWGDYSGMVADPDGQHMWYLGEYSKAGMAEPYVPNDFGNWGTFIQQVGFGADDHLFASNFDNPRVALEFYALTNLEDADTAPGGFVTPGEIVNWRYVVINTGEQKLRNILIKDDKLTTANNPQGIINCPRNELDIGEDMFCETFGTAITGQYTNTATINAVGVDGTPLTTTNSSNYLGFIPLVGAVCSTTPGSVGCNQALPDDGTQVTSTIIVAGCTTVTDVNLGLSLDHTYTGDLFIRLTSPTGTTITMLNSPINGNDNCSTDNVRALLDDASGSGNVDAQCRTVPPAIIGTFKPSSPLSAFNGQAGNGVWTLRVDDVFSGLDTGTLNDWSLQLSCQ